MIWFKTKENIQSPSIFSCPKKPEFLCTQMVFMLMRSDIFILCQKNSINKSVATSDTHVQTGRECASRLSAQWPSDWNSASPLLSQDIVNTQGGVDICPPPSITLNKQMLSFHMGQRVRKLLVKIYTA